MACLKMVLDFYLPAQAGGKQTPPLLEMYQTGEKEGGYSKSGWYHEYFLKVARGYGLNAERGEKIGEIMGLERIHDEIKAGYPVIVSTTKHILGQTKFHMVVLTGYEENEENKITGFYFNEPESLSIEQGEDLFVDIKTFLNDWRKMAIFIHPPKFQSLNLGG